ncbi:MAG: hypothetical protein IJ745_00430 [Bacteroidales bacterium]|nr:hypothetical protein [Bacteroidales bacterium]
MITMMYLVYTAMLALNVSAEVVEGFRSVGTAMTNANINLQEKLDDTYSNFDAALQNSRDKVQNSYDKAQKVRQISNELKQYLDSLECEFIGKVSMAEAKIHTDPENPETVVIINLKNPDGTTNLDSVRRALQLGGFAWMEKGLDDTHEAPKFFLDGATENGTGQAYDLHKKISEYVTNVKEILGEDSTKVKFPFDVDKIFLDKEGKPCSWEVKNFDEVVAGAGLVTLTRMKAETMNAEFDAVNMLYKQVSKGDKTFSDVAMISRPRSTYILQGGTYETKINVAAYDSKQTFRAVINGQNLISGDSGTVVYRTTCNTLGPQRITGTAYVTSPDGGEEQYPINDVYFVAKPAGVVRLDGMQVVYAGLENPITVSAAGIDNRNLKPVIEGGQYKLNKGTEEGSYVLIPAAGSKKLSIHVDATIDGKTTRVGSQTVFVKDIPAPVVKVAGVESGGRIAKKDISASTVVIATKSKDFNLKIDNRMIRIVKMTVGIGSREETVNGARFNESIASMVKKAVKGDKLVILAEVMMPDGKAQTVTYTATLK